MASFDCEWQELLNGVASYKNSADVIEHIKNKLQQHNRGVYEKWRKNGFHINHIFRFGTLLHFAVKSKSEDVVESVIKAGADVNLQDSYKVTPLYYAAENGYLRVVEALLKAGAKIDVQDRRKETALHRASAKGYSEVVEALIKAGANVNMQDVEKRTPLHQAVENGRARIVEVLLKAGAKIDEQGNKNRILLHSAAANGHSEIVKALIKAGANVDVQDVEKRTPLHRAAENGCSQVVEVLLKAGAKIDVKNDTKNTALHMAVKWSNLEIIEELIKAGANVNLRSYDVHTPSQVLEWFGIDEESVTDSFPLHSAAQDGCARMVEVLLNAGAKINAQTEAGDTALHAAVKCCHLDVVQILIKAGANVNKQGEFGRTPLHSAAEEEFSLMIEALLKAGADPNIQDSDGQTPLHSAALGECAEDIEALLKAGASVYILDDECKAPLHYQCVVRILIALEIPLNGTEEQKQNYQRWYDFEHLAGSNFERKHSQYWGDCLCEVKKMKAVKIGNGMTVYDVLRTKDINKLASYVRNKNRALLLETYNYNNEFPLYANDLRRKIEIGKERLYYLDLASVILKNMEHVSALSHFCHIILMIAEEFTNDEIEDLKEVVIELLDEKKRDEFIKYCNEFEKKYE